MFLKGKSFPSLFKQLIFIPLFFLTSGIAALMGILRYGPKRDARTGDIFIQTFYPFLIFILGFKLKVVNRHKAENDLPLISVANHQENLDLISLPLALPSKTISIGKKSMQWIPFFGQLYWLSGHVLIDRGSRKKALNALNTAVARVLEKGWSILIFPEGTRSRGRGLLPFKKGPFHMSVTTGRPLSPVLVSSYEKLNWDKWFIGVITIEILDPIYPENMTTDELLKKTRKTMEEGLARLNA